MLKPVFAWCNRLRLRAGFRQSAYIIVVPNTLHFLDLCLKLLPENYTPTLLINGAAPWEVEYLKRHHARFPQIALWGATSSQLWAHGEVLDLLLESNEEPLTVIDHDCFILDPHVLELLRFDQENDFAVAPFTYENIPAGILFPSTFLMVLNPPILNKVRKQYGISSGVAYSIPESLIEPLRRIGIGTHNYPYPTFNHFDTWQLLSSAAIAEQLAFSRPSIVQSQLVHISCTSYFLDVDTLSEERRLEAIHAHYGHMRILEQTKEVAFRERYLPYFSFYGSSDELLRRYPQLLGDPKFNEIEQLIESLAQRGLIQPCSRRYPS